MKLRLYYLIERLDTEQEIVNPVGGPYTSWSRATDARAVLERQMHNAWGMQIVPVLHDVEE